MRMMTGITKNKIGALVLFFWAKWYDINDFRILMKTVD